MFARRLLLACLVLATAYLAFGCATPQQICDVQKYRTGPMPVRGEVLVTWRVTTLPPHLYEWTVCDKSGKNCHIEITDRPDYNEVCRLADLGHGVLHAAQVPHN